jgi:DNA-binding XRE family transcriptional regulator
MLSPDVIRKIQQLLEERQHTHRKIATSVGVSRSTVAAVAKGERRITDTVRRVPKPKPKPKPPEGIQRCPSCGAKVRMPCLLCQMREMASNEQAPQDHPIVATPIGLELKPEQQARYAEVRRWRREALRRGVVTRPHPDPLTPDP